MPDDCYTLHLGDCLSILPTLPDKSCNCCVTSPPYYNLRDYGTATWEGGDVECDHLGEPVNTRAGFNERWSGKPASDGNKQDALRVPFKDVCGKCGARRIDAQIGLESTPAEYVAKLVAVFREVRRVLTDEGTVWLNLGDSYAGGGRGSGYSEKQDSNKGTIGMPRSVTPNGMVGKQLLGIPWRVAFALQDDGWILRQDIIWAKGISGAVRMGSCMPESVTDRCTKAHEYVFLLTKQPRYYFDHKAIQEEAQYEDPQYKAEYTGLAIKEYDDAGVQNPSDIKRRIVESKRRKHAGQDTGGNGAGFAVHSGYDNLANPFVGNRRSVWHINPQPFKGAHFAVMPEALVEPCILAGCPVGGVVLDPFAGSGTVGVVAVKNGRSFIGVELNPEYVTMANQRIADAAAQGRLF